MGISTIEENKKMQSPQSKPDGDAPSDQPQTATKNQCVDPLLETSDKTDMLTKSHVEAEKNPIECPILRKFDDKATSLKGADPIKDKMTTRHNIQKIRTLTFKHSPNVLKGNEDETANKNAQIELVLMKTLGADIVYMNIIYGHCVKDPRSWVHRIFRNSQEAHLFSEQYTNLMAKEGYVMTADITEDCKGISNFLIPISHTNSERLSIEEFNINDIFFLGPFNQQSTTTDDIQQPIIVDTYTQLPVTQRVQKTK
ncbi:hypothetical protein CTI12_AA099750 [Artemisia annua]|uniref:PHL domain-containing protein n=1 Tax=Artemisia annua TaxID=35608 RepID=A0A2U1PXZ3_ARTAN|nr:hypothetical protein CTI12_AA099750 [Artemisia annua]